MSEATRYARQTVLPEIGPQGQAKLAAARILVVGAGGLGCPALLYLAGAGIGTLGIVDFDAVSISNLPRQILFTDQDEGRSKAAIAKARLEAMNPHIVINAHDEELTERNVVGLFSGYDIIVDGTDNFAAKFLINDAAVKLGKPVVYGALQGFEAQVSVFDAAHGPCYRCLYPQPPKAIIMNCAQAGVIGALAGLAGTMQAMEGIKLIVAHESFLPLIGRLWMIDAHTMETNVLNIKKRAGCPVCSRPASEIIPCYASPACAACDAVTEIRCEDVLPDDVVFIDVREREEWETGRIEGAEHMPLSVLQKNPEIFASASIGKTCVLYCQRGLRSRKAAEILFRAGFTGMVSLKGGYEAWRATTKNQKAS